MRRRNVLAGAIAGVLGAATLASAGKAAAASQCLSATELGNAGRMASVMAVGGALQRCSSCLSADKYAEMVHAYEDARLMDDFWTALKALDKSGGQSDEVGLFVRESARKLATALSADCGACAKTTETLKGLSSERTRGDFYARETAALANMQKSDACP